jgi:hypothetical protein
MTPTLEVQHDDPNRPRPRRWAWIPAGGRGGRRSPAAPAGVQRLLFLDDDPERAAIFLEHHPHAVWVTTVPECLARLAEPWDEVHLDHDLGGKMFVDSTDSDCGMEVIRWLCKEPRAHLKDSLFFVHSHNATAGLLMVLHMRGRGYKAEFRPFGFDLQHLLAHNEPVSDPQAGSTSQRPRRPANRLISLWRAWLAHLRRWREGSIR